MIETGTVVVLQWIMIGITAVGLGATWVRNGRSTAQKYGVLGEKVDELKGEVVEQGKTLDSISSVQNQQLVSCSKISTDLAGKIKSNEQATIRNDQAIKKLESQRGKE